MILNLLFQQHRKVLDKGKPDDIMPAIKGAKVSEKAGTSILIFVCVVFTATEVHTCVHRHSNQLPFCANRNDYQQCLYPECLTSPEEKLDSLLNWSRISCGSEQRVRLQLALFCFNFCKANMLIMECSSFSLCLFSPQTERRKSQWAPLKM